MKGVVRVHGCSVSLHGNSVVSNSHANQFLTTTKHAVAAEMTDLVAGVADQRTVARCENIASE